MKENWTRRCGVWAGGLLGGLLVATGPLRDLGGFLALEGAAVGVQAGVVQVVDVAKRHDDVSFLCGLCAIRQRTKILIFV
jgi:hypothetical protein